MSEQPPNNNDMSRIERGVERLNDKMDNVITSMASLQANQARMESEVRTAVKETEDVKKESRQVKEYVDNRIEKIQEEVTSVKDSQSSLREKIGPVIIIATIITSVAISKIVNDIMNPPKPAPYYNGYQVKENGHMNGPPVNGPPADSMPKQTAPVVK